MEGIFTNTVQRERNSYKVLKTEVRSCLVKNKESSWVKMKTKSENKSLSKSLSCTIKMKRKTKKEREEKKVRKRHEGR